MLTRFRSTVAKLIKAITLSTLFVGAAAQVHAQSWGPEIQKARPGTGPAPIATTQQALPIQGLWRFVNPNNGSEIVLALHPNQTYEFVVWLAENGQRSESRETGRWAMDGQRLVMRNDAGETNANPFQLNGNQLVVEFKNGTDTFQIPFQRATNGNPPTNNQPAPPPVANAPHHPAMKVLGTWHCEGTLNGTAMYIRATFGEHGAFRVDMVANTADGQVTISGQGTWAIYGNLMVMNTELGEDRVPFEFRGDALFLDFSQAGFTLEMVRMNGSR